MMLGAFPSATSSLASVGEISKPFFAEFVQYVYPYAGILMAVVLVMFLYYFVTDLINDESDLYSQRTGLAAFLFGKEKDPYGRVPWRKEKSQSVSYRDPRTGSITISGQRERIFRDQPYADFK